jgi:hypothetical protein
MNKNSTLKVYFIYTLAYENCLQRKWHVIHIIYQPEMTAQADWVK